MCSPVVSGIGFVLLVACCILLIAVTISTPVTQEIYIAEITGPTVATRFGVLGACFSKGTPRDWHCTPRAVGYTLNTTMLPLLKQYEGMETMNKVVHHLSPYLIANTVAGGLAGMAYLTMCLAIWTDSRMWFAISYLSFYCGFIVVWIGYGFSLTLKNYLSSQIKVATDGAYLVSGGAGLWCSLGAAATYTVAILLVLAVNFSPGGAKQEMTPSPYY